MKFSNISYGFYPSDEDRLSEYQSLPEDLMGVLDEDLEKFRSGEIGPLVQMVDGRLETRVVEKTDADKLAAFLKSTSDAISLVNSVGLQCYMAGIDFPADWKTYRIALIALSKTTEYSDSLVLPTQPGLPSNI